MFTLLSWFIIISVQEPYQVFEAHTALGRCKCWLQLQNFEKLRFFRSNEVVIIDFGFDVVVFFIVDFELKNFEHNSENRDARATENEEQLAVCVVGEFIHNDSAWCKRAKYDAALVGWHDQELGVKTDGEVEVAEVHKDSKNDW